MPTGRRHENVPVPFFFQPPTAETFATLQPAAEDVVLASMPKGGTTWTHKIIHLLLHGLDDDGQPVPEAAASIGAKGQVYPEALPLEPVTGEAEPGSPEAMRRGFMGTWRYDDLLTQTAPRLFSTHLFGKMLPSGLLAPTGSGKLVVVLRNVKDVLSSLHFFRGVPKDDWLGNEHGPGSLERFLHADCPNAYGSAFTWMNEMDAVVQALQPSGRVLVVYYEDLVRCLPAQVDRLAAFLGLSLTPAKRAAVLHGVAFDTMKKGGGMAGMLLRKGGIGDWKNHLSAEHWAAFDAVFDERCGSCALAEPLRTHQEPSVGGLPPPLAEQTTADDPRVSYAKFTRHTLVEGRLVRDNLIATGSGGKFTRPSSEFMGMVEPPGTDGAKHVAEAGRYHLFVSGVCPWASSVRCARHLMGLQSIVSIDVADGQSGRGWAHINGTSCPPWAGQDRDGPFFLHEVYQASDPLGTCRITMPVLWDKHLGCIVSNDSWSILKMFSTSFASLAATPRDLYPAALAPQVEERHSHIYRNLLNAVYIAGIGILKQNEESRAAAEANIAVTLDELEASLQGQRFLMGAELTAVDLVSEPEPEP